MKTYKETDNDALHTNTHPRADADYLSQENTSCLKGILAIGVLLHHLYQYSGLLRSGYGLYLGVCFQALGFVCVAIFFFLSGYGLVCAYKKRPEWIDGFLRKKVLPFYLIILFFSILYGAFRLWMGETISAEAVLHSLSFGGTVIKNGWYLQTQLAFYLLFYIVFRHRRLQHKTLIMTILLACYIAVCIALHSSALVYERAFVFAAGMAWAESKEKIDAYLARIQKCRLAAILLLGAFAALYGMSCFVSDEALIVLFRAISYFPFVGFVLMAVRSIRIQNAVMRFFGKISLELYIMQGFGLMFFRSTRCNIENPYWYVLITAVCAVLLALAVHPAVQGIYRLCRGIGKSAEKQV